MEKAFVTNNKSVIIQAYNKSILTEVLPDNVADNAR